MKPCKYLDELIDYGGEPYTRAEAILDMQRSNTPQPCIARWLQGYEHAQRRHFSAVSPAVPEQFGPKALPLRRRRASRRAPLLLSG